MRKLAALDSGPILVFYNTTVMHYVFVSITNECAYKMNLILCSVYFLQCLILITFLVGINLKLCYRLTS